MVEAGKLIDASSRFVRYEPVPKNDFVNLVNSRFLANTSTKEILLRFVNLDSTLFEPIKNQLLVLVSLCHELFGTDQLQIIELDEYDKNIKSNLLQISDIEQSLNLDDYLEYLLDNLNSQNNIKIPNDINELIIAIADLATKKTPYTGD
jgi:hypothetical protein